jgi:hypothetical protein
MRNKYLSVLIAAFLGCVLNSFVYADSSENSTPNFIFSKGNSRVTKIKLKDTGAIVDVGDNVKLSKGMVRNMLDIIAELMLKADYSHYVNWGNNSSSELADMLYDAIYNNEIAHDVCSVNFNVTGCSVNPADQDVVSKWTFDDLSALSNQLEDKYKPKELMVDKYIQITAYEENASEVFLNGESEKDCQDRLLKSIASSDKGKMCEPKTTDVPRYFGKSTLNGQEACTMKAIFECKDAQKNDEL